MSKNKSNNTLIIVIIFALIICVCGIFFFLKPEQESKQQTADKKEISNVPVEQVKPQEVHILGPFKQYKYKFVYDISINGHLSELDIKIPLPVDEMEKQYITDEHISIKPKEYIEDGINKIASYKVYNIDTQNIKLSFEGVAKVRTYNLETAKALNENLTPEYDLTQYLEPEQYIESDDKMIENIARSIEGRTKEEIVQNIFEYVQKNVEYKVIPGILGAKKTVETRMGKCSEYAALMVALCRAKNIPARVVIGDIARKSVPQHNWVEVYYDEYGWVMYDPTMQPIEVKFFDAKGNLVRTEKRYNVSRDVQYITNGRNLFNQFTMNYRTSSDRNGTARVVETIDIEKINPE